MHNDRMDAGRCVRVLMEHQARLIPAFDGTRRVLAQGRPLGGNRTPVRTAR